MEQPPFETQVIECKDSVMEELIDVQNDKNVSMRYQLHVKHGLWYHQSIYSKILSQSMEAPKVDFSLTSQHPNW